MSRWHSDGETDRKMSKLTTAELGSTLLRRKGAGMGNRGAHLS